MRGWVGSALVGEAVPRHRISGLGGENFNWVGYPFLILVEGAMELEYHEGCAEDITEEGSKRGTTRFEPVETSLGPLASIVCVETVEFCSSKRGEVHARLRERRAEGCPVAEGGIRRRKMEPSRRDVLWESGRMVSEIRDACIVCPYR